jgi:hypothetical protein
MEGLVAASLARTKAAEENVGSMLDQAAAKNQRKWQEEEERQLLNAQILENLDEKVAKKADIQMVMDRVSRAEYQNAVLDLAKANELVMLQKHKTHTHPLSLPSPALPSSLSLVILVCPKGASKDGF